jgi:hypothetical protein
VSWQAGSGFCAGAQWPSHFSCAAPAGAATFTVSSPGDSGPGTLRDAIYQANANPGADVVSIPPMTIQLTTALPDIISEMTIEGSSAAAVTVRRLSGSFRVFTVAPGAMPNGRTAAG